MGQQISKYQIKEGWNQKLSKIQIIQSKSSKVQQSKCQFKVKYHLNDKKSQFQKWKHRYEQLISYEEIQQYIILPLRIEKDNCMICSDNNNGQKINIYYRPFYSSLHHEINTRKQQYRYYTQQQLWYLLLKLIKIASYFQWKKLNLGNIHPKNIILFNQDNTIKLFSIYSSPNQQTNLHKIQFSKHEDCYIAPQQIQIINPNSPQKNQSLFTRNKNKIDLFTIGLTLISAALLKDCYFIYQRTSQFIINQQRFLYLKESLRSQNKRYSDILIKIILEFLQSQPNQRKAPIFYYSFLSNYEEKIHRLETIHHDLQKQLCPSPLVMNYHNKSQNNTKQSKFLTLTKNFNTSKDSNISQQMKISNTFSNYYPGKINRKLFS